MARKFLTPIDMGQLEVQNLRIQNVASAPGSPVTGQVYYDTTSNSLFFRNNSTWINANPTALLALANTWTNSNVFNGAITGNNTINLTGTGSSGVGGLFSATAFAASGITGATTATRYVGGTASGAPASGTFSAGDHIVTTGGDIWICTTGGSPGTWSRVGSYLLGTNNTWTGTQTFNGNLSGSAVINLTGTSASSVGGTLQATAFIPTGLTGATSASRYVGATTSGAPSSGTFAVGDFAVAQNGAIWVCTTAGSPGTWVQIGASGSVYSTVKANNGTAVTQRSTLNFINGTFTTATATDNASQTDVRFDVSVAAPTGTLAFGGSNNAGAATTLSRSDHSHAVAAHDAAAHSGIVLNNLGTATANYNMGGFILTNVGTPSAGTDVANKAYVDGVATGLDVKASVRVASTANVTVTYAATGGTSARGQITAAPNTLDGVTLANGNRILLKDQSTAAQNGIWVVTTVGTGANGVWDRATDFDQDAEVTPGAFTFVEEGTVNADSGWIVTNDGTITIGGASGTALAWTQFSGAGQITAGAGLTKTGNTLNVGAGTGIVVNADDIAVNRTGTNNAHVPLLFRTGTHSAATSIAITHNLGQQFVHAQVFETSSGNLVEVDVTCTSTTVTTFTFAVAPTANTYTFVIYG